MARLTLTLLGPLHCGLDGAAVEFKTKLAQALLVYLAVEAARAHPRETLAALLWPDRPEDAARHNLRQTLLYVRQALHDASAGLFLQSTRQMIQFNTTCDYYVDAAQFSAHLEATRRHRHLALVTCADCMARLAEAAALYRGDFLAQFFLENSQPFEEWALAQREALRAQMLEALVQLAGYHTERGDLEAATRYARRQVELDSLREVGYQQWMRAAALRGRRSQALGAYDDLRRLLDEELSVAPAAATTALYEQIAEGRLSAASPVPAARPPPRLPRPFTLFVGREKAQAEIQARLDDSRCALLTLIGPGGVGKTTLALEVTRQRSDRYRDGVAFVPLASLASPDHLATAIGAAVALEFTGKSEPITELLAHLSAQQRLLVLDNFEPLLASEAATKLLLDLLQAAPEVQLLVTSREVLNLRAEWLYEVSGLPYPPPAVAGAAQPAEGRLPERYAAVRLFMQQAHRLRHNFAPDAAQQAAIGHLCRLVEGLPLAIELAAALTRTQTCEAIAAAVERNLDSLTTTQRDAPARQRNLRALFDYSWELLGQSSRDALCRLAVFRGGLTAEAAEQVAQARATDLARLADKSMLRRQPDGRFALHEVLRQYAAEKLAETADAAVTHARHATYFARWVQGQETALSGEAMAEAIAALQAELDNVRAAWAWAVGQGDLPALARSLAGLARFYVLKSLTREGEAALAAAVGAVRARLAAGAAKGVVVALFGGPEAAQPPEAVLAALLVMHGRLLARLARPEEAAAAFAEGIALAQAPRGRRIQALGYVYWGQLDSLQANYPAATAKAVQAVALAQATGWVKVEADALRLLGNLGAYVGDLAASRRYYERCLPLEQATGDKRGTSASLSNLGSLCLEQGDWAAAEGYFEQALALHRELGDQVSLAQTLMFQGQLAQARGDSDRAQRHHAEALQITRAIGDRQHEPDALLYLGLVALAQGRPAEAQPQLDSALGLYRATGDRRGEATVLEAQGRLAVAQGLPAVALQALEAALAIRNSIADRAGIASAQAELGHLLAQLGQLAPARARLSAALQAAQSTQATALMLRVQVAVAAWLARGRRPARALEVLACVLQQPGLESQARTEARREWSAAAATVTEREVAVAQTRGQRMEPESLGMTLRAELAGLDSEEHGANT